MGELWDVEAVSFFSAIGSQMAVRSSALRGDRLLSPGRFMVSFLSEAGSTSAVVRLDGVGQLRNLEYIYIYIYILCITMQFVIDCMYVLVRARDAGMFSMTEDRTWPENYSNKRETKVDTLLLHLSRYCSLDLCREKLRNVYSQWNQNFSVSRLWL
jgi:hypothetical protein